MYLLDTNVISELRKPRPHGAVLAWLQAVDNANLQLASVSLGEIKAGIEITREQDAAKASAWAQLMHRLRHALRRRHDYRHRPSALAHHCHAQRQGLQRFRCGTVQSL